MTVGGIHNFNSLFSDLISYYTPECIRKIGRAVSSVFSKLADSISSCFKSRTVTIEKPNGLLRSILSRSVSQTFAQRERVDPRTCSPRMLQCGPKTWAQHVIKTYGIVAGKNCYGTKIKLDLPFFIEFGNKKIPGHSYYVELQKQIADVKKGEDDSQKPSIDLKLFGQKTTINDVSEFAIIGGIGCLADADLLDQTMAALQKEKVQFDRMKISLYSNPPPREMGSAINLPAFVKRTLKYLNKPHKKFFLASNTAHINFNKLNIASLGYGINMVKIIANNLRKTADPHVLILGTTQAYKANLYPNELHSLNVDHQSANEQEQQIVQEEIDKLKHNILEDGGERLFSTVQGMVGRLRREGKRVNQILLGCTELPAILKPYIKRIKKELGVTVIDSQREFAKIIANSVEHQFFQL
jgi:aspartate/glutamate racemase